MSNKMNIIDCIEKDHRMVETLLARLSENAPHKSKITELLTQLKQVLLAHNRVEESVVYTALEKRGSEVLVIRSQEEHKLVEQYLEHYLETFTKDLSDASLLARVEVLKNLISTHIEEEEEETFEKLKEEFSEEELRSLGQKFQNEKDQVSE